MRQILFFLFTMLFICLQPSAGFSHKVTVFAYAQGDTIIGEALFSGGRPAKKSKITVENAADATSYLTTVTDEEGMFSFKIPAQARQAQADLRIVLLAGEAHRNEYIIKADEYLPGSSASQGAAKENSTETENLSTKSTTLHADEEAFIRQLVKQTIDEEMAPFKQRLRTQASQEPTLRDILGGIGCIFGIAGIIAYCKSRKRRDS